MHRLRTAKPSVEPMEARSVLSGGPAWFAAINPGLAEVASDGAAGISSTRPGTLQFVVLSQANVIPFAPASALVPRTIRVDGVGFRDVTVRADPVDLNADGIADAIVTIRTRGTLAFPPGPGVLVVTGTTHLRVGRTTVAWASAAAIEVPFFPVATPRPSGLGGGVIDVGGSLPNQANSVGEGSGLGVGGSGFTLYNGYINIVNDTSITVYESLLTNSPPGGNPPANPGVYSPLVPHQTLQVYTGPGTIDQLAITANFSASRSGSSPFYAVWYAGHMTLVNTFPIPPVITWYLHQNPTGQFYFNTTP